MADIDPAVAQQVLSMQDMDEDPQAIQLARRQRTVDALRGQSMQTNQGQMMGKIYAPGNTLATTLGRVAQGVQANHEQQGVDQGMDALGTKRVAGRTAYFNALTNAMRRPSPVVKPGMGSNIAPTDDGMGMGIGGASPDQGVDY